MPNSIVERYRKALAEQGVIDPRSDDDLTLAFGERAQLGRPDLLESNPDFARDYNDIRIANSPGTLGGIVNTAKNAFDRSRQALNVAGGIDETDAQDIAEAEHRIQSRDAAPAWQDWTRSTGPEAVKAFLRDPIEITSNIVASGFAGSLPALAGGVTGGVAGAAAGGPAAPVTGPIGAAIGTGAGSLAVEYGSKYLDVLREAGADLTDPDSIGRVVSDPETQERARDLALRRGVPVALFDAISAGLAGKFLKGVRTATAATNVRRGLTEAAIQGALGGGGEVAGALSAGEEVRPGAVFEEVVGELGPGAVEVGGAALRRRMAERGIAPAPVAPRAPEAPRVVERVVVEEAPVPLDRPPVVPPARRVALMTDEQRAARFAELSANFAALAPDEQQELELLRAFVGEAPAPVAETPAVATPVAESGAPSALPNLAPDEPVSVGTLPATGLSSGSPEAESQPQILAPARESIPAEVPLYQYTIQQPQDGAPGYLQIDEIVNGEGRRSSDLATLRAEGIDLPEPPAWLPTGQYSRQQVEEAIAKGPPVSAPVTPAAPAPVVPAAITPDLTVAGAGAAPVASLPSGEPAPVLAPLPDVAPAPQPSPTLESRLREELRAPEPFAFGKVVEGDGLTVDLRDDPRFDSLTPEMAKRVPVTNALGADGNKAKTRVAVVLEAPDGTYVKTGLLVPQEMAAIGGSGAKDTGPAVQSMASERRAGGYQKMLKVGGNRPALLSDVIGAGYKLRAIVHFDAEPGVIFQRFSNRAAFDASYGATERGTGATAAQKVIPTANAAEGTERKSILGRRDAIQRQIDVLATELESADPARAAEINDEVRQLYSALGRLPEPRLGTENPRGWESAGATDQPPLPSQADRADQFATVAARLRQAGARVDVFPTAFFRSTLETHLKARLETLIEDYQNAPPVRQPALQAEIESLQQQIESLDRVRGVTYDPQHIVVGLDDVEHANLAGLVWLLHEGNHAILGRDPEMQARVLRAVAAMSADLRKQLTAEQEKSGVREARLEDPEELLVSSLAQKLANEGIPDSPSLARAVWQWVKDLYFRVAMSVQAAFGVEPSPALALGWFENQVRRIVGGDLDYRFTDVFDRFRPVTPAQEAVSLGADRDTPSGLTDFHDPTTNRVSQPDADPTTRETAAWDLRFATEDTANPGTEIDIPFKEAKARIMAAAINEEATLAEKMFADLAPEGMTFDQFWATVGRGDTPKIRLAEIGQQVPGAETAAIGGERMTDPMNQQARVWAKRLLQKWQWKNIRRIASDTERSAKAETGLVDQAKLVNKIEADLRNADMHEATLRDKMKEVIRGLTKGMRRGLDTAFAAGELAQAVREVEDLAERDPIPAEYQTAFKAILADEVPVFQYLEAIAKMDMPLGEMTLAEIRGAVDDNASGDATLARLMEPRNRPLLVALTVLAKKNAAQMDMIQLRAVKDPARYLAIKAELDGIRNATEDQLKALARDQRDGKKAATFADRLKRDYVNKRAKLRRMQTTIQEAEERRELLASVNTAIGEKVTEIEGGGLSAPSEWTVYNGAPYLAMQQTADGGWKSENRVARFTPSGPAENPVQMANDLASNWEYLKANADRAGTKTYEMVKRQTQELSAVDVKREYPEIRRVFFEKWFLPSADLLLSGGGPGAARAARMLQKFQFITFKNWHSEIDVPAVQWVSALEKAMKEAGIKDRGAFLDQVYDPVLYHLQTEPGLDEGPALREAVRGAKRRLPTTPTPQFDEAFKELMRQTKGMSERFLKIAEDAGVFVADKRIGGELRRAVARGWLTTMRRTNVPTVATILGEMSKAGWAVEEQKNGAGGESVRSTTFDALKLTGNEQTDAAKIAVLENPQALQEALRGFFTPTIIQRWLEPFLNKPGEPLFAYQGDAIDQLDVQKAWEEAGGSVTGDVAGFIDRLGARIGLKIPDADENGDAVETQLSPEADFRASMLRQMERLYVMESRLVADANQVRSLYDPSGAPPHLLMDARENELLPAEHIQHMTFDLTNARNLIATLAFHAAFGRNGVAMDNAIEEIKSGLLTKKQAFDSITSTSRPQRKADAERLGYTYKELKDAASIYKTVEQGEAALRAQFGFGNAAGELGDIRGGLQLLHFIAAQATNNPKTGFLNLLQVTQRAIVRRSVGPGVIRDTASAGTEVARQFFGQLLESFGLHILRASEHAREVGAVQGQAFGQIPWTEVLGTTVGKRGEELPLPIKAMRGAMALQRKGARIGFGESREFPRMANVPIASNVMQGIGLAAAISNGTAEATAVESLVKSAMDYFAANPEDARNPSFRLTAKDLGKVSKAWFNDEASFNYFRRKLVDYGVGNIEQVARDAMERSLKGEPILTRDDVLKVAMMSTNELDLQGSINTDPAILAMNPVLKFAMPLLGYPIRQMNQMHQQMRGADGRRDLRAALKTLAILAAWSLPVGLAFTFMTDEYDEKFLRKKSNLGDISGDLSAKDNLTAMLQRLSRAGNIYGLGLDAATSVLAGTDPTSGARPFSMDSRILAFSQIQNIYAALSNWINSGFATTYANVERPLINAIGGSSALQAVQLFGNALGLDNQEMRVVSRINAQQWLRAAGREAGLELRRGGGGSTAPTPTSVWLREMSIAAYGNDRLDFLHNYRRAVDEAREAGAENPEQKVYEMWRDRNPLDVFRSRPDSTEMAKLYSAMDDSGKQAVRDALRLYENFTALIAPSNAETQQRRMLSQMRSANTPPSYENLRRRMASGALSVR